MSLQCVANLLNIQRVVVGGGVAKAGHFLLEPARKSLKKTALKTAAEHIELVEARLGENAGMIGAAYQAMTMA